MSEFAWITELEKAMRKPGCDEAEEDREDEDQDGYEDEDEGEGEERRPPVMRKSAREEKGRYAPAPNGENDEDGEEPKVHHADSLDQKSGGGKVKYGKKGLRKGLDEETQDAIEVSDVLTNLTKSIEGVVAQRDSALAEVTSLKSEIGQIHKSLAALGGAMCKALSAQEDLQKSMAADVARMGRQPAERKAQVRRIDKSFAGGANAGEVPAPKERLEKSMAALAAGKISVHDSAVIEQSANVGEFRHDLWQKVVG